MIINYYLPRLAGSVEERLLYDPAFWVHFSTHSMIFNELVGCLFCPWQPKCVTLISWNLLFSMSTNWLIMSSIGPNTKQILYSTHWEKGNVAQTSWPDDSLYRWCHMIFYATLHKTILQPKENFGCRPRTEGPLTASVLQGQEQEETH